METIDYAMIAVVAGAVGYVTRFNDTLNVVGERLSATGQGKSVSLAISPPWYDKTALVIYGIALIQVGDVFYRFGFLQGIGYAVGVLLLMSIMRLYLLPKISSPHFLKAIYRSMINRHADFVRDNDIERAAAIKYLIDRFESEYLGGQTLWDNNQKEINS